MPIERPTFHESWYRVAELHPRLRTTVQVSRQHFRGQPWHVIQDHTNNAFFRLAEPAYQFIGLLDGRRSVGDAWKIVNDQLGDDAPTQGEVIQLLGQLYTSNLLQAEVPSDTHTLFLRYKKRKGREISSYLMNIMFARIPLIDPDNFLNHWNWLFGWIFSPLGFILWAILVVLGCNAIGHVPDWPSRLVDGAQGILSPQNLIMLYIAFACIKACHEMGHAISCKKFGRQSGSGGEVHVIGIMFLIFTPIPYVDASSSWALRNKWHRAIVGAAGMWVELGIAAIAAMIWANSNDAAWQHAFAYNVMFVASFSTIIFNANPLLRYDGYYMLADVLEIPNLGQRANEYIYYIVKKYVWNVRFARSPAYSNSERGWLFAYAIASFLMRVLVSFSIMFYLANVLNGALIFLAAAMALAGIITWVAMPIGKFIYYLGTNSELARVRTRAVITTLAATGLVIVGVGMTPFPDHSRAQGVVEPLDLRQIYAGADGFVHTLPALAMPTPDVLLHAPRATENAVLLTSVNPELTAQRDSLLADRDYYRVQRNVAYTQNPAQAQLVQQRLDAVNENITHADDQISRLTLRAPINGLVVMPDLETRRHAYIHRGEQLGVIASLDHLIIRAAIANDLAGPLAHDGSSTVQIRVDGRPDILFTGRIAQLLPAGSDRLPSAALGYSIGGEFNTAPGDKEGTKTVENFFEVRIDNLHLISHPTDVPVNLFPNHLPLYPGQRVIVRFTFSPKPIASQAWTALLQLFQRKFKF